MMSTLILTFAVHYTLMFRNSKAACFDAQFRLISPLNIAFKEISAASDGTMYGVGTDTKIYRYTGGSSWSIVNGGLTKIAVGSSDLVYGIGPYGKIWKLNDNKINWSQTPQFTGTLSDISVGKNGGLWVIDSSNTIYRLNSDGSSWTKVSDGFVQTDVTGSASEWVAVAVDTNDKVYYRVYWASSWTRITGALTTVDIAWDNSVYGINTHNYIYQLNHDPWADSNAWSQICSAAISVTVVNEDLYYIVGTNNHVYKPNKIKEIITPSPTSAYGNDGCSWSYHSGDHRWRCDEGYNGNAHYASATCPSGYDYCGTGCKLGGCPSGWEEKRSFNCGAFYGFVYNELCYKVGSAHSEILNVLGVPENDNENIDFMHMIELNVVTSVIVSLLCMGIFLCIYKMNCGEIKSKSSDLLHECDEINEEIEQLQVYDDESK